MAILINATTEPHLVPLANGLAQSAVSLARFLGRTSVISRLLRSRLMQKTRVAIAGGTIWSLSIADGPTAHAWPFNYALGFVTAAAVCFIGLCVSTRLH